MVSKQFFIWFVSLILLIYLLSIILNNQKIVSQIVQKLVRILPNGQQVKREVDFVLDECFETMSPMHFHIREVIFVTYNKVSKNIDANIVHVYQIIKICSFKKKKCHCIVHQKSERTNYKTCFIYLSKVSLPCFD